MGGANKQGTCLQVLLGLLSLPPSMPPSLHACRLILSQFPPPLTELLILIGGEGLELDKRSVLEGKERKYVRECTCSTPSCRYNYK